MRGLFFCCFVGVEGMLLKKIKKGEIQNKLKWKNIGTSKTMGSIVRVVKVFEGRAMGGLGEMMSFG